MARHSKLLLVAAMALSSGAGISSAAAQRVSYSPRTQYILHCSGCHGIDGSGLAGHTVPTLRQAGAFLSLDGGREFLISVPGVLGSGLSDREIAELSNWLLATLAADPVPKDHRPFDAADVQRARSTPLADPLERRRKLVDQARARGISLE